MSKQTFQVWLQTMVFHMGFSTQPTSTTVFFGQIWWSPGPAPVAVRAFSVPMWSRARAPWPADGSLMTLHDDATYGRAFFKWRGWSSMIIWQGPFSGESKISLLVLGRRLIRRPVRVCWILISPYFSYVQCFRRRINRLHGGGVGWGGAC